MKAATLSIAVFMLALLVVGCSDQSQVTGPQANTAVPQVISKNAYDQSISVETTVMGPGYMKFHIIGEISYELQMDGIAYFLSTNAKFHVDHTASDMQWDAYGTTEHNSIIGITEYDIAPSAFQFHNAPYAIAVELKVDAKGVSLGSIAVLKSLAAGVADGD